MNPLAVDENTKAREDNPITIIDELVEQEGVEHIDLSELDFIDPGVLESIPQQVAIKYRIVPFARDGKSISVAMANPFDLDAERVVRLAAAVEPKAYYASEAEIEQFQSKVYLQANSMLDNFDESEAVEVEEVAHDDDITLDDLEDEGREEPTIRKVNTILISAVQDRASDVHIEPQERDVKVRFRVDGVLREVATLAKAQQAGIISRIKILSSLDIAERRVPQDGRTKLRIFGRGVDIRVSTLPTIFGEKIVLRILDQEKHSLDIADLGLEASLLEGLKQALQQPYGLILVTGPTGSGKTTTLYSALSFVNSNEKNIITVEDPVEYQLPGVNQIQVQPDIGLSFAAGLRSILRQDPDIIMVGEMRDLETAEIAMRGALTGHLVFSTLHTNNSVATLMRLIEMGIDRYLICSSVHVVLAQRLVRRLCFHCSEPYEPDAALMDALRSDAKILEGATLYKGSGCSHCSGTGYWGRLAVFEFFYLTDELRDMIVAAASVDDIRKKVSELGMETLLRNGLKKVHDGLTTIEEVLQIASTSL